MDRQFRWEGLRPPNKWLEKGREKPRKWLLPPLMSCCRGSCSALHQRDWVLNYHQLRSSGEDEWMRGCEVAASARPV